ncbi:MAG: hypothetical protein RL472_2324, partial [Pseudomonadota bacterium]
LDQQVAHLLPRGDVGQVQLVHAGIAQVKQRRCSYGNMTCGRGAKLGMGQLRP